MTILILLTGLSVPEHNTVCHSDPQHQSCRSQKELADGVAGKPQLQTYQCPTCTQIYTTAVHFCQIKAFPCLW